MMSLAATDQSSVPRIENCAELHSSSAALLERPWHDELRHLDRGLCAEIVDARLRALARREALARRVLGSVADVFLHRRAHDRLGFVRLNDYARERLGLSARELQSVAKVTADLHRLPALAAAFERGELSWTQAPSPHPPPRAPGSTPPAAARSACSRISSARGLSTMIPPR